MKEILCIVLIALSVSSFSQSKEEPIWWELQRNGEHLQVASYLIFKVQSDSTRNRHADYLHIARSYGYLNDYEKATFYWKESGKNLIPENDPQFWWYYKGTLAFFERDKETLLKYMTLLNAENSEYYKNNAFVLKSLYQKFDKGYEEACDWKN